MGVRERYELFMQIQASDIHRDLTRLQQIKRRLSGRGADSSVNVRRLTQGDCLIVRYVKELGVCGYPSGEFFVCEYSLRGV